MLTMPKCYDCGRFCRPVEWKMIYSGALPEPQEEIYKCAGCVEKNGSFHAQNGIKPEYSCGKFPPYPNGAVVGPCVCGSWPGGNCLLCPIVSSDGTPK